ncbi:MAG: PorV/PorQ family protein [Candidatus Eisenbacteria bacterium]|uniref:PorV/PorQ family protein n=1 Tax=Eiseniibacteriota bacterium TaxID=2212470 RepID=A0A956M192_UNCEI|nr:PorV/PorQ family protein [Candidatus Eisenbacteria bacterium]
MRTPLSKRVRLAGTICAACMLVMASGLISGSAFAQTQLGGQRVATSSGTFLKIGIDARGAALGGAYNTLVEGAAATFYNPAGIIGRNGLPNAHFSYAAWPAGIDIGEVSFARPFDPLGGQIAVGFAFLGTDFEETTEFYPTGTGRTLSYSDFLASVSFARLFTDRLTIGVSAKYLREDMGSNIGGPVTTGLLFDAGTIYEMGYRNGRLAITLMHFGPDLSPNGTYTSHVTDSEVSYSTFSPPTLFQLGFSIDAYAQGPHRVNLATQVVHPADQNETLRAAGEYWLQDSYALRAGYDFAADELAFSAGLGLRLHLLDRDGTLDYSFTEGGNLSAVHRWSLGFGL